MLDVIKLSILETFRKKMHFSKVLVFAQAIFGTLVPDVEFMSGPLIQSVQQKKQN